MATKDYTHKNNDGHYLIKTPYGTGAAVGLGDALRSAKKAGENRQDATPAKLYLVPLSMDTYYDMGDDGPAVDGTIYIGRFEL